MGKKEIFYIVCGLAGIWVFIYPIYTAIRRRIFRKKVMDLKFKLLRKISKHLSSKNRGMTYSHKKIVKFLETVRLNIPDYHEYQGYHFLANLTPNEKDSPKLDLPKPYSVIEFLKKVINEAVDDKDIQEVI